MRIAASCILRHRAASSRKVLNALERVWIAYNLETSIFPDFSVANIHGQSISPASSVRFIRVQSCLFCESINWKKFNSWKISSIKIFFKIFYFISVPIRSYQTENCVFFITFVRLSQAIPSQHVNWSRLCIRLRYNFWHIPHV